MMLRMVISPERFQELVERFLKAERYEILDKSRIARELGVDFVAKCPDSNEKCVIKTLWRQECLPIGPGIRIKIGKLLEAAAQLSAEKAIFVTTDHCTEAARLVMHEKQ